MDFAPGLRLMQRWWPIIIAVVVLASALAYAASFLITPTYSSSTRVLIRARDTRFLTSTGEDVASRPGVIDAIPARALNQTLAGLATSRPVAEQVVRELQLDQPAPQDTSVMGQLKSTVSGSVRSLMAHLQYGFYAEPAPFEGAVQKLLRSVSVTPLKDSYLMEIKVRWDNPSRAAEVADAVTRAFVRQSVDEFQRNASSYRTVLSDEVERARGEVDLAEQALRAYREQHKIVDVAEAIRLGAVDHDALQQQLRDLDSDLNNARARHTSLERTLATLSPTERSTTTTRGQNVMSTSSTGEVGRSAPTTLNDTTTANSESRESVAPNRVYQDLQRDALALSAQIAGLEAKRSVVAAGLADRVQLNAQLAQHTAQINALELQRSTAHATFSSIRATYESAVVNDARGAEEVTQVDAAAVALYPERPVRYVFLALGLICGLAGGVGLALMLERWSLSWSIGSRRVARPIGAQAAISIPGQPGTPVTSREPAALLVRTPRRYEI